LGNPAVGVPVWRSVRCRGRTTRLIALLYARGSRTSDIPIYNLTSYENQRHSEGEVAVPTLLALFDEWSVDTPAIREVLSHHPF
jgi:hypothetical protein